MKSGSLWLHCLFSFCVLGISYLCVNAADWPQLLGPSRDGVYSGKDIAAAWPKDGPPILWQRSVGEGFSGPVVSDGKLILFHRLSDQEIIECLDSKTGNPFWTNSYPTHYRDDFGFDEGPRAAPAISENRVYTYGAEGMLTCLDLVTGTNVWTVNAKKDFRAPKGFFGVACSPLVEGKVLLMTIGGKEGAGIVAFDKSNGKVLWKATDDEPSYSSPTCATLGSRRTALFLTRTELVATDPVSGRLFFRFPFSPPIHSSVSAATPLVIGDKIFLSASYDTGAVLLKVDNDKVEKVWSGEDILSNHYATSVHHNGFLYGVNGRTDPGLGTPTLRCVELNTGKVRWKKDFGAATVTLAGNELLILTERGELVRAPASPEGFQPTGRAQVLSSQVRAYPALAGGLFYARSKDRLVCLDLRRTP